MAQWIPCFRFVMDNEDSQREYKQVPDSPAGAFAISGINSAAWPAEFAAIAARPQGDRADAVEYFYYNHFWNEWYRQIDSDEVAKRVLDMAVNGGPNTSVKLLQKAIEMIDPDTNLDIDGVWGPHTILRVNLEDAEKLTTAFRAQRIQHYEDIVAAHPEKSIYLDQWKARALK